MNRSETSLIQLLRAIVSAIGTNSPNPEIEFDENVPKFQLRVHPDDHGRIIGKKGANIGALETVMWYAGLVAIKRFCRVELLQPRTEGNRLPAPFLPNKNWDRKKLGSLVSLILSAVFNKPDTAWVIEDADEGTIVRIVLDKYLKTPMSDPNPDIEKAMAIIIRAAGMAAGAQLQTVVEWK